MPANDRWSHESSIPVLKRKHRLESSSVKKAKQKNLPDIRKYVESIIKANNELVNDNNENNNESAKSKATRDIKASKNQKKETLGKSKPEKNKNNFCKISETLASCEEKSVWVESPVEKGLNLEPEKKSPEKALENDKGAKSTSEIACSTAEIENFLKKLYPNPYYLEKVNEFRKLRLNARTWKYEIEKKTMESGQRFDMMFLSVTDKPDAQILVETPEKDVKSEKGSNRRCCDRQLHVFRGCEPSASDSAVSNDTKENELADVYYGSHFLMLSSGRMDSDQLFNKINKSENFNEGKTGSIFIKSDDIHSKKQGTDPSLNKNTVPDTETKNKRRKIARFTGLKGAHSDLTPISNTLSKKSIVKSREISTFSENSSEYDMGKLKMLTSDCDSKETVAELSTEVKKCPKKRSPAGANRGNSGRKKEKLTVSGMTEISRNLELLDARNRTRRHRNKLEVKKLYDIVDKTTQSLLEITARNQREIMEKKEADKNSRQNAFGGKFENNKLVQFIRKMNSMKEEKRESDSLSLKLYSDEEKNEEKSKKFKKINNDPNCEFDSGEKIESSSTARPQSSDKISKNRFSFKLIPSKNSHHNDYENITDKLAYLSNLNESYQNEFLESNKKIDEMMEGMRKLLSDFEKDYSTKVSDGPTELGCENFGDFEVTNPEAKYDPGFEPENPCRQHKFGNDLMETTKNVVSEPGNSPKERSQRKRRKIYFQKFSDLNNVSGSVNRSSDTCENEDVHSVEANLMQMVEEANELGGYNEEQPADGDTGNTDGSASKNLLPLSVRIRKRKNDASDALKKALENEEKMIVNRFLDVHLPLSPRNSFLFPNFPSESDLFSFGRIHSTWKTDSSAPQTTLFLKYSQPQTLNSNPLLKLMENRNPNFVICVNSLPAHLRTAYRSGAIFSMTSSAEPETKAIDAVEQPLKIAVSRLKCVPMELETSQIVLVLCDTRWISTVNEYGKAIILHVALSTASKLFLGFSLQKNSHLMINPECRLEYKMTPLKTPKKESLEIVTPKENEFLEDLYENPKLSSNETIEKSGGNVIAVEEVVGNVEKSIHYIEQISIENVSGDFDKTTVCKVDLSEPLFAFDDDERQKWFMETEDEKTRIQNLLLRTYNLQRKLHRHLKNMNASEVSCGGGLLPKVSMPDLYLLFESKMKSEMDSALAGLKSRIFADINSKSMQTDPCIHVEEEKLNSMLVDHGTSCHSSIKEELIEVFLKNDITSRDKVQKNEGNEDPIQLESRSSTSSFKSSNDVSETNEKSTEIKDLARETPNISDLKNLNFLRKIFSDLEVFRKSFQDHGEQLAVSSQSKEIKKNKKGGSFFANAVVEKASSGRAESPFDETKSSSKVLKTVFKGKDSTTELAIGLKDVLMRNISVEKRKYSPNHTKISISISKEEESDERKEAHVAPMAMNKARENSIGEEENSPDAFQVQESAAGEETSDEDEDDFKSVASTLSRESVSMTADFDDPDLFTSELPVKKEPLFVRKKTSARPFRKHRFDFYQKMSTESSATDKPLTRYDVKNAMSRELEPLRKALTDMQIRMRSIKRNSLVSASDYFDRALKLAKMSAGYCRCCGHRGLIPEDTFGFYKSILPRRYSTHQLKYCLRNSGETNSSFYSFRSSTELSDQICELDLKRSSAYLDDAVLRKSLNNVSFCYEAL